MPTYRFRGDQLRVQRLETGSLVCYEIEDEARRVRHRLYATEYEVAQLLDGKRDPVEVAKLAAKKTGLALEPVDVESFAQQLLALGFVEQLG